MVGVNPEVAHEQMAGLNFFHAVAQAIEAGKLFHIDLNDQKPGRFDQDLRFGSESIKPLFFLVKLLEESGYDGPRHFDAHAYRTEDEEGVWDFARGCMRTVPRSEKESAGVLESFRNSGASCNPSWGRRSLRRGILAPGSGDTEDATLIAPLSPAAACRPERLDQMVVELLLGV